MFSLTASNVLKSMRENNKRNIRHQGFRNRKTTWVKYNVPLISPIFRWLWCHILTSILWRHNHQMVGLIDIKNIFYPRRFWISKPTYYLAHLAPYIPFMLISHLLRGRHWLWHDFVGKSHIIFLENNNDMLVNMWHKYHNQNLPARKGR